MITNKGLLLIGNYNITELNGAAKIRIWNIYRVLNPKYTIIGFFPERLKGYIRLFRNKEIRNIRYIYLEPSASTANPIDLLFLIYLRMKNVRMSIFIRDVYPYFKHYWKILKWYQIPHYFMWFIAIFLYTHIFETRYYPTVSCAKVIHEKNVKLLPPGCNLNSPIRFNQNSNIILYSGKITKIFGEKLVIEIAKLLKKNNIPLTIGIVFREDISHLTNIGLPIVKLCDKLSDLKKNVLFGIIPRKIEKYNHLAFPLKLADYVQIGVPVLVTNCYEMAKFVGQNKIGYVLDENPLNWFSKITYLWENKNILLDLHKNTMLARQKNSWDKRASIIFKDFNK